MNTSIRLCAALVLSLCCLLAGCPKPTENAAVDANDPPAATDADNTEPAPTDSETSESDSGSDAGPNYTSKLPDDAPVLKTTPGEIIAGNKGEDRDAYRQSLEGKWLEVSGVVTSMVQRAHYKTPTVKLADPGSWFPIAFQTLPGEAWQKVNVGDEVTYRMAFTNWDGFVDARVIAGGSPPKEYTASELAQAFLDDVERFKSELVDKHVVVSGKVLDAREKFEKNSDIFFGSGHIALSLVGKENTPIAVKTDQLLLKEMFAAIKPGDQVRIFGKVEFRDDNFGEPEKRPFKIGLDESITIPLNAKPDEAALNNPDSAKEYVIDVRSKNEWDGGHVASAVHIPHTEIADRIDEVTTDKSAKIVLYCAVGGRAGVAKTSLENLGYTNVENAGGYDDVKDRFE